MIPIWYGYQKYFVKQKIMLIGISLYGCFIILVSCCMKRKGYRIEIIDFRNLQLYA